MDDSLEFTGETTDEAVATGLEELGLSTSDVIVEILEEPSRGVFGIGARKARVRLRIKSQQSVTPPKRNVLLEDAVDEDEDEDESDYRPTLAKEISEPTEDGAVAKEILTELLTRMDFKGFRIIVRRADVEEGENPPWILDIEGKDINNLIGRRGETLNALQYITRLIASRHLQRRANIIVDADGYKSKRSDRLEQLAVRMADQAVRQNRTVYLEPMPPNERRIIHMTLRSRTDVETKSLGDGETRKVTIIPLS